MATEKHHGDAGVKVLQDRLDAAEKVEAGLRGDLANMERERDQWMNRAGLAERRLQTVQSVLLGAYDNAS